MMMVYYRIYRIEAELFFFFLLYGVEIIFLLLTYYMNEI
jgi:hypothetical protein